MSAPVLTELQEDALSELLNLGMGLASSSLSEMVNEEVHLSVPSLEFLTRSEFAARISGENNDNVTCVSQEFTGTFWGNALLLFPEGKSLSLVRALTGDTVPMDDMSSEDISEMEQDVLSEVGNIVLNACLGSLANVLGDQIKSDVPVYMNGTGTEIMSCTSGQIDNGHVMLIRLDFSMPEMDVMGYVVFLLGIESIQRLQEEVDKFLGPEILHGNG